MYVSIMERKGIEKGIQIGRTEGIQIGEAKGIQIGEDKGVQIGEAKGIQIGEAKGIQIGKTETARNLLRMGLDLTKIVEATGLPLEEVRVLQSQAGPTQ